MCVNIDSRQTIEPMPIFPWMGMEADAPCVGSGLPRVAQTSPLMSAPPAALAPPFLSEWFACGLASLAY